MHTLHGSQQSCAQLIGYIFYDYCNVNVNVKTAIAKRLAVHIMNPEMINETKKFSADDGKQSEIGKR